MTQAVRPAPNRYTGGAISLDVLAVASVDRCTIVGSQATVGAGIAVESGATLHLNSSHVAQCTSSFDGSAVMADGGSLVIVSNSTIMDNVAVTGAAVVLRGGSVMRLGRGTSVQRNQQVGPDPARPSAAGGVACTGGAVTVEPHVDVDWNLPYSFGCAGCIVERWNAAAALYETLQCPDGAPVVDPVHVQGSVATIGGSEAEVTGFGFVTGIRLGTWPVQPRSPLLSVLVAGVRSSSVESAPTGFLASFAVMRHEMSLLSCALSLLAAPHARLNVSRRYRREWV